MHITCCIVNAYISNYGWIKAEVSTEHVRQGINALLRMLHMTIDTQLAIVGRKREEERKKEREREKEICEGNEIKWMKHCCAKSSAQLPKHTKSLQDDTKHVVMKPETSSNWSNHKNVHCMQLHNAHTLIVTCMPPPITCWCHEARSMRQQKPSALKSRQSKKVAPS